MTLVTSAQSYSQEITYVSRGKNPPRPYGRDYGTFVLNGPTSRAVYRLNAPAFVEARLRHYLERGSVSDPRIRYLIYEEEGRTRLWAFQFDGASPGNFVIYVNETGEWWLPDKWRFYDLSNKYAEWPEAPVYESVVISAASPIYYTQFELVQCCLAPILYISH